MNTERIRKKAGFAAVALVLALVVMMGLIYTYALTVFVRATASESYDMARQRIMDGSLVRKAVSEAYAARLESVPTPSAGTIPALVDARLTAIEGGGDASFSMGAYSAPSTPRYWPYGSPPANSTARSGTVDDAWIFDAGPYGRVQTISATVSRTDPVDASVSTISVSGGAYSVPITNFNIVAYGLPQSGNTPESLGSRIRNYPGSGFWTSGGKVLAPSQVSAADSTAFSHLSGGLGGTYGYYYRHHVSLAWNLYETIFGASGTLMGDLHSRASSRGTLFDIAAPADFSGALWNAGLGHVEVDLDAVTEDVIFIKGTGRAILSAATNASASPLTVVIGNGVTAYFTGDITRPVVLYVLNADVFFGNNDICGALLLSPHAAVDGSPTIRGHLSYYALNLYGAGFAPDVRVSATYRNAVAPVAPRQCLVIMD